MNRDTGAHIHEEPAIGEELHDGENDVHVSSLPEKNLDATLGFPYRKSVRNPSSLSLDAWRQRDGFDVALSQKARLVADAFHINPVGPRSPISGLRSECRST